LTGQDAPSGIDGISVLPAWLEGRAVEHPPLYWEFHERGFSQAARIGDWKAVRPGRPRPIELYDLAADHSDRDDVAGQLPEVVKRLADFLASARVDSELWPIRERSPRPSARAEEVDR